MARLPWAAFPSSVRVVDLDDLCLNRANAASPKPAMEYDAYRSHSFKPGNTRQITRLVHATRSSARVTAAGTPT